MWFKHAQLFQLTEPFPSKIADWEEKLMPFAFKSCLPSLFESDGWISPVDEENATLTQSTNGKLMLCLQVEEKILPATVVQLILQEKIKDIERIRNRPVKQKEKFALKDEIIKHLLPRAFSKYTRLHAIVDIKKKWLILDTANEKKTAQFIEAFKKSISEPIQPIRPQKLSSLMAQWLKNQEEPAPFSIEKACVLYDPRQKNRIIRCQQHDLFSKNIQAFLQEGCEVKQLALSWRDCVNFVLSETGSLHGTHYQDQLIAQAKDSEAETKQQQFDADFLIMSGALFSLLTDLVGPLIESTAIMEPNGG